MKFYEYQEIRNSILRLGIQFSNQELNEAINLWYDKQDYKNEKKLNEAIKNLLSIGAVIGTGIIGVKLMKKYLVFKSVTNKVLKLINQKYDILINSEKSKGTYKLKIKKLKESDNKNSQKLIQALEEKIKQIENITKLQIEKIDRKIENLESKVDEKLLSKLQLIKANVITDNEIKLEKAKIKYLKDDLEKAKKEVKKLKELEKKKKELTQKTEKIIKKSKTSNSEKDKK